MAGTSAATSIRQRREATVREHIDAENRHDIEAAVSTFSKSRASYDIPAFGEAGQRQDHAAVRELWVEFLTVFPDLNIEAGPMRHGDDHVFVEVRVTGTQHADWAGIPAIGRSFNTRIGCLYEFEDDQLVCERVYLDFGEMARQLGAAS
jgi:steroid delta-isomerase-like uncharacterized protein